MKSIFSVIILTLLFIGCGNKTELPKEKTARVFVDLLVLKEKFYFEKDSLLTHQNKTFEKYSTTRQQYESALAGYENDEEQWNLFFDYAEKYLDSLRKSNPI